MRAFLLACLSACLPASALAQQAPPPVQAPADWGQALREDAQAFHDIVRDNHPGPVDVENPGFVRILEDGLALALRRAETADSRQAWRTAMAQYVAAFNDGHLGITGLKVPPAPPAEWPGFMVGRVDGGYRVVYATGPAAPPVGARLASCDGVSAEDYAQAQVGAFEVNWPLESGKTVLAPEVFYGPPNPYAPRASACIFGVEGAARVFRLTWSPISAEDRRAGYAAAAPRRVSAPAGVRTWSGGAWVGLGSFGGADGTDGDALQALVADVEARAAELRAAPILVLDLRGNDGGSSAWINAMAGSIWGEGRVAEKGPRSASVDWRASDGNLATIESYLNSPVADQPGVRPLLERIVAGMTTARQAGQPLWSQIDPPEQATSSADEPAPTGRVYVLTDRGCASACLDAVDLLKALGAVQVGQETSADTQYLEIREAEIPSGRFKVYVPMKVYRGRPRGNSEPHTPAHAWPGSMSDTAGLENWIAELARMD